MSVLYNLISQLRGLNTDAPSTDELVGLQVFGVQLRAGYESNGLVAPEWLTEALGSLSQAIADRRRDELMREAKLLQTEMQKLKTKQERRAELAERQAEIDKLLGRQASPSSVTSPVAAASVPAGGGDEE